LDKFPERIPGNVHDVLNFPDSNNDPARLQTPLGTQIQLPKAPRSIKTVILLVNRLSLASFATDEICNFSRFFNSNSKNNEVTKFRLGKFPKGETRLVIPDISPRDAAEDFDARKQSGN
jgi:hypothetical protein